MLIHVLRFMELATIKLNKFYGIVNGASYICIGYRVDKVPSTGRQMTGEQSHSNSCCYSKLIFLPGQRKMSLVY